MAIVEGPGAIGGLKSSTLDNPYQRGDQILVARVYEVLLNDDPVLLKKMNVPSGSIGYIQCRIVSNGFVDETDPLLVAKPLNFSIKKFPLENELVTIMPAQTPYASEGRDNTLTTFYYLDVVGVWDSVEHNAIPDNSFFDREKTNKPDASKYTNADIGSPKISADTPDKSVTGKKFEEKGKIRKLKHVPGDFTIEGRFGNSLRFGSSNLFFNDIPWKGKTGNPVTILSNTNKEYDWKPEYEDINNDGTILGFFIDHELDFIPANGNFKTYNQSEPTNVNNIVVKKDDGIDSFKVPETDVSQQYTVTGSSATSSSVASEIDNFPDSEDNLEYNQEFEEAVPLRSGVLNSPNFGTVFSKRYNGGYTDVSLNRTLVNSKVTSNSDLSLIEQFAGNVNNDIPGITKSGRALLDLIAVTEGTIGRGNYNGYDYVIGNHLIPGFDSPLASPPHPNTRVLISRINNYSTAAGRYQFLYDINWYADGVQKYGLTGMSKYNQNLLAWKTITIKRNISVSNMDAMGTDFNTFKLVIGGRSDVDSIDGLSPEYASLPDSYRGIYGFYKQAGRYSFEVLFELYKKILSKY